MICPQKKKHDGEKKRKRKKNTSCEKKKRLDNDGHNYSIFDDFREKKEPQAVQKKKNEKKIL
jgi:hypothetical protein